MFSVSAPFNKMGIFTLTPNSDGNEFSSPLKLKIEFCQFKQSLAAEHEFVMVDPPVGQ